jgi:hypothetical protein
LLVCSFLPHNDTLMFDGYCLSLKCPVLLDQYREWVVAVDHLFALSMPAFVSASFKKSFSRVS